MFGCKNTIGKALILSSVLALTGSLAMAQRGGGPGPNGEGPRRGQADGEQGPRRGGPQGQGQADGEQGPRGPRDGQGMQRRLFAGMDLTDEQKEQIQVIMKKFGDERRAWHEEHQEDIQALRQKMRDARESKDKEAMEAVRKEMQALMESAPKPDAAHDEVRALLTEEQQKLFDERLEKMRERAEQMRDRGPDGPPPPGMGPDGPPPGAEGPGRPGARLFANLNLSEEQQAQVREIMQSDKNREEKMAAVRDILTDEQKAQLDENIEKMRQWREQNPGERPRRGDGPPPGDGPRGPRPPRGDDQGNGKNLDL